jgi:nitrite reductase (cytochrome c-552)
VHELHRSAQLRWDFVFVENSQGFHNHEKAMRYLREAEEMINDAMEMLP